MKKKKTSNLSETETSVSRFSDKQQQICKQLDLLEWAMLNDETEVGFAVRNGL